ncbi:FAD-binding oxidoreductase [Parendozoicomonas haliclonae]|uniref:L-gulono-1,4-lactone dehydrogenase n=1 Tax=Parendozoicomonas haliclonae TaxID=1960125 RepID=A0A1X7AJS6_9GAMM|nr:FAD-binding oxidoreductase [Parendozoicomonas haliclonae]SMA46286.1 L-gulono-1,4-lactone dehydrogenase [Parendozoicomonas haliclonae]
MIRPSTSKLVIFMAAVLAGLFVLPGFTLFHSPVYSIPLQKCTPAKVLSPDHPIGLERILDEARKTNTPVSILGAGYSQGGQTCANDSIQINTREMNQLMHVDLEKHEVTVQAGVTWKRLQEQLSFFGLSVAAMQSYADFTVGGSLGVNAHGQDVHWNPVSKSVVSMRVLLTDGRHIFARRDNNPELFRAVIGTYGLVGIITEVTLKVLPNTILHKKTELIKARNYSDYFSSLQTNSDLALHSARLSINPLYRFKNMVVVNFFDTGEPAGPEEEKYSPNYPDARYLNYLKKSWLARTARTTVEYFWAEKDSLMTRNQAMGESVSSLANTHEGSKDILQEYFLPPEQLEPFIHELKLWVKRHKSFTLVNATVRSVNADKDSLLPYAPEDRFAVVLFINLADEETADNKMQQATRELIDTVLNMNGRYYLPYALYATKVQLHKAYPEISALIAAKQKWDRAGLLNSQLYQKYF